MTETRDSRDRPQAQQPEAERFHIDRILADSYAFFDHPAHVVAGALANSNKTYYTLAEVRTAINQWLKTPVEGS